VETYSIKKLEPLYDFVRTTPLPDANHALAKLQALLELGDPAAAAEDDRRTVESYNRDDCFSTWRLRDWLEARRAELVANGVEIERPLLLVGDPSEGVTAWQARLAPTIARLTEDVAAAARDRTPEQQARWLLAHMLDWHRREQKATWWELFRLGDLMAEELLDERAALSGLTFLGPPGGTTGAPIHRYSFPPQEAELRGGEGLRARGGAKFGSVQALSVEQGWVEIKKRKDSAETHPEAVFAHRTTAAADIRAYLGDALMGARQWRDLIRLNGPGIKQALSKCLPISTTTCQQACQIALWTGPEPAAVAKP
jgi:hypothetical protein